MLCVLCTNCDVFACYRKERLISSSFSVLLPLLEKMSASFSSKLSAVPPPPPPPLQQLRWQMIFR
ncbi:unnamed protein product [Musa hybrid cultivar]